MDIKEAIEESRRRYQSYDIEPWDRPYYSGENKIEGTEDENMIFYLDGDFESVLRAIDDEYGEHPEDYVFYLTKDGFWAAVKYGLSHDHVTTAQKLLTLMATSDSEAAYEIATERGIEVDTDTDGRYVFAFPEDGTYTARGEFGGNGQGLVISAWKIPEGEEVQAMG